MFDRQKRAILSRANGRIKDDWNQLKVWTADEIHTKATTARGTNPRLQMPRGWVTWTHPSPVGHAPQRLQWPNAANSARCKCSTATEAGFFFHNVPRLKSIKRRHDVTLKVFAPVWCCGSVCTRVYFVRVDVCCSATRRSEAVMHLYCWCVASFFSPFYF